MLAMGNTIKDIAPILRGQHNYDATRTTVYANLLSRLYQCILSGFHRPTDRRSVGCISTVLPVTEAAPQCAASHSERNIAGGGEFETSHMTANDVLHGGSKARAISSPVSQNTGRELYALETGLVPRGETIGASKGEAVQMGTRFLTAEDRIAVATYLMDQPND